MMFRARKMDGPQRDKLSIRLWGRTYRDQQINSVAIADELPHRGKWVDDEGREQLATKLLGEAPSLDRRRALKGGVLVGGGILAGLLGLSRLPTLARGAPGDAIGFGVKAQTGGDFDAKRIAGARVVTEFDGVKHAGTVGDPFTPAAWNNAISDIGSGGGMLFGPAVIYLGAVPVSILNPGFLLDGMGWATQLQTTAGNVLNLGPGTFTPTAGLPGCIIRDMYLKGAGVADGSDALKVENVQHYALENLRVSDALNGIHLKNHYWGRLATIRAQGALTFPLLVEDTAGVSDKLTVINSRFVTNQANGAGMKAVSGTTGLALKVSEFMNTTFDSESNNPAGTAGVLGTTTAGGGGIEGRFSACDFENDIIGFDMEAECDITLDDCKWIGTGRMTSALKLNSFGRIALVGSGTSFSGPGGSAVIFDHISGFPDIFVRDRPGISGAWTYMSQTGGNNTDKIRSLAANRNTRTVAVTDNAGVFTNALTVTYTPLASTRFLIIVTGVVSSDTAGQGVIIQVTDAAGVISEAAATLLSSAINQQQVYSAILYRPTKAAGTAYIINVDFKRTAGASIASFLSGTLVVMEL